MAAVAGGAPVESLLSAVLAFLRRYPPFDGMEEPALRYLAGHLALGYFPKGTVILSPDQGEPAHFHIVQRGVVQLATAETYHVSGGATVTLGPGECFSVGALLEKRAVGSPYVAAADTFCYLLPAAEFGELLRRSPRFQEFSTRYLASLLRESRRLLKMQYSSVMSEQQAMNRSLRSLVRRGAVSCRTTTPLRDALLAMQQAKVGSIVVTDDQGAPVGIFTRHDLLDRVALAGCPLDAPMRQVMTPQPKVLSAEASAYEAAMLVAHGGVRHVPVVDAGKLIGVVTERDLFALQRVGMREINRSIAAAGGTEDLQRVAADIRRLAASMMTEGVAAEQLTLIVSTLNDALTARIVSLEAARHDLSGLRWCWLAFGSEGRLEQTISTDQDNGIVFEGGVAPEVERQRLLPFAQGVNRMLDSCGFPLCKGDIMAGNPQWCLSLTEWQQRFSNWIANTDPQALLRAVIFFDFRATAGEVELADAMRRALLSSVRGQARFLRQLAQYALETRPPIGLISDFVTEDVPGAPGTIDLKKSAGRLFVDAARVLSLAAEVEHTQTAQRLRQAGARLSMSAEEVAALVDAFFFIQGLRLRQQLALTGQQGRDTHNRIAPDTLNEVDRRILKECLRQARKLQSRLELDYQL